MLLPFKSQSSVLPDPIFRCVYDILIYTNSILSFLTLLPSMEMNIHTPVEPRLRIMEKNSVRKFEKKNERKYRMYQKVMDKEKPRLMELK